MWLVTRSVLLMLFFHYILHLVESCFCCLHIACTLNTIKISSSWSKIACGLHPSCSLQNPASAVFTLHVGDTLLAHTSKSSASAVFASYMALPCSYYFVVFTLYVAHTFRNPIFATFLHVACK